MRQFVWALVMMAGCSPWGEPLPLRTEVISDLGTFVAFDAATGVLSLRHDSGWAVSTGGDGRCSAFSAALRPAGTDPRRFHGPEAPPEDLVWMHLRSAEVTGDGQWTLALRSDDGTEAASATLSLRGVPSTVARAPQHCRPLRCRRTHRSRRQSPADCAQGFWVSSGPGGRGMGPGSTE